jgi:hypothetical protein
VAHEISRQAKLLIGSEIVAMAPHHSPGKQHYDGGGETTMSKVWFIIGSGRVHRSQFTIALMLVEVMVILSGRSTWKDEGQFVPASQEPFSRNEKERAAVHTSELHPLNNHCESALLAATDKGSGPDTTRTCLTVPSREIVASNSTTP